MGEYRIGFDQPGYLALLVILPVLWFVGRNTLAAIGRGRRMAALLLRAAVVAAIVAALADVNLVRVSDRVAVLYLVDRSLSVSPEQAQAAIAFVNKSRAEQRDRRRGDLAGVIVFGREAAVELPPWDTDFPLDQIEAHVDAEATDLAGALRLARACFPHDCAKRLVIVSDGNENVGSALREAAGLADAEIGIDVVPIPRVRAGDVAVEKVTVPGDVRRGLPFDVKIVLANSRPPSGAAGGAISGRLRIVRQAGNREDVVADQAIDVGPGKQVFSFREELTSPDFYSYDVRFVPGEGQDALPQNNRATAFTQVRGNGRVLVVEDWANPGRFAHLVDRLRAAPFEVDVQASNQLFSNLAELQRYDTVILADVPRTSGVEAADLAEFTDEQIDILVRNTQQMAGGLVMLGGPNSFGAGGWTNTALERAMPVDFQIKNAKVVPSGALVLVIDHSGSMSGGKLEMSKAAAVAALRSLGERDYIGVVGFDSAASWVVPIQRVGESPGAVARIARLGPGGGTNMMPGMAAGYGALQSVDTSAKHMIVLTDGRTEGEGFQGLTAEMRKQRITTTCVAVGTDADAALMQSVARAGGGKFYRVNKPTTIPRIFMKEAMRVARPLVFESEQPFAPRLDRAHEMLAGVERPLPPITGYVLTTAKANPLVEVSISAPVPASVSPHALLASWTYGLGRAVAWTTDAGERWTKPWSDWSGYDKLFTQIVRWSMRPAADDGKLELFAEARDGKLRIVATALDGDGGFLNFLPMRATVLDPAMQSIELTAEQVAPGRYVGECAAEKSGTYFVTLAPGQGLAPRRVGVTVGYSAEFRDSDANEALLENLAAQTPKRGAPGRVIRALDDHGGAAPGVDVFRRDLPLASSRQPVWHLMVLVAACLFVCDVFNRRVIVSLAPIVGWVSRLRRRESAAASVALERLRTRKDEIARQLDERRATARFEPAEGSSAADIETPAEPAAVEDAPKTMPLAAAEEDADSYTARLLRAKRGAWKK